MTIIELNSALWKFWYSGGINISAQKIRVAIIEDNKDLCKSIIDFLTKKDIFEIVGTAYEGGTGLKLLQTTDVDVVLLDIILPVKDGISILEDLRDYHGRKRPSFIMFTAVSAEAFTQRALELGADYFILKPFDLELLSKRIVQIFNHKEQKEYELMGIDLQMINNIKGETPEQFITNILRKAGISPNLKGYAYLKTAVLFGIEDRSIMDSITKGLYPAIAKEYNTTSSCVERAIRHAIGIAWEKSNSNEFYQILGYNASIKNKPTNSSFILSILELYNNTQPFKQA